MKISPIDIRYLLLKRRRESKQQRSVEQTTRSKQFKQKYLFCGNSRFCFCTKIRCKMSLFKPVISWSLLYCYFLPPYLISHHLSQQDTIGSNWIGKFNQHSVIHRERICRWFTWLYLLCSDICQLLVESLLVASSWRITYLQVKPSFEVSLLDWPHCQLSFIFDCQVPVSASSIVSDWYIYIKVWPPSFADTFQVLHYGRLL